MRPRNRGLWRKVKCLHREEFVVVGWTDPEGRRPWLGALLLGYYDPNGRLIYAGRVGAGINQAELERLWRRLQPLATSEMQLDVPSPRSTRFGSAMVLSRVHWVRHELVVEVKFLTWTGDNLLRQVVYEGLREAASPFLVSARDGCPKLLETFKISFRLSSAVTVQDIDGSCWSADDAAGCGACGYEGAVRDFSALPPGVVSLNEYRRRR